MARHHAHAGLIAEEAAEKLLDLRRQVFAVEAFALEGGILRLIDLDLDADDGRTHALDNVSEGILAWRAVGRDLGDGGSGCDWENGLPGGEANNGKAEYAGKQQSAAALEEATGLGEGMVVGKHIGSPRMNRVLPIWQVHGDI